MVEKFGWPFKSKFAVSFLFYTKKTVQNVCKLEHHADLLKPGVLFFR